MMNEDGSRSTRQAGARRWPVLVASVAVVLGALIGPTSAAAGPNDTMAGASGPILSGVIYDGTMGTENDVDWWVFYAEASTQTDIALMGLGPEGCFGPEMGLYDVNGRVITQASGSAGRNETVHILRTVSVGTFYLRIEPSPLDVLTHCGFGPEAIYRLWINASPALLSAPPYIPPPPEVSSGCRAAQRRVANLRSRLKRSRSRRQRNRLRAKLRKARSTAANLC